MTERLLKMAMTWTILAVLVSVVRIRANSIIPMADAFAVVYSPHGSLLQTGCYPYRLECNDLVSCSFLAMSNDRNDASILDGDEPERRRRRKENEISSQPPFQRKRPTGRTKNRGRRETLFAFAGAALGLAFGASGIDGIARSSPTARRVVATVSDFSSSARKILYERVLNFGKQHGTKAIASEELTEWIASQSIAAEYPEIATWIAAQQAMREAVIAGATVAESAEFMGTTTAVVASAAATLVAEGAESISQDDGLNSDEEYNDIGLKGSDDPQRIFAKPSIEDPSLTEKKESKTSRIASDSTLGDTKRIDNDSPVQFCTESTTTERVVENNKITDPGMTDRQENFGMRYPLDYTISNFLL